MRRIVTLLAAVSAVVACSGASAAPIMRLELHLAPDAKTRPQILFLTLGGGTYCGQIYNLQRFVNGSLACTDYGPNRYLGPGQRAGRKEDWGDPAYLAAVAKVPAMLRAQGVKISKLVLVGVSYTGFANAELVATHPELRPAALVVVDSFLDLPARYAALPSYHETKKEMDAVLGGTLQQVPQRYADRSPSNHLAGLAQAIRSGMSFVDVWSTSPGEKREFVGATCSRLANAQWLANLAQLLGGPVTGYVTQMPHAHALWFRGQALLQLAGIAHSAVQLPARRIVFKPDGQVPPGSFC
jgi:pimeloyl-ACP methyl ester carboxylesterase